MITVNQGCECSMGLMPGHSITFKIKLASKILLLLGKRIQFLQLTGSTGRELFSIAAGSELYISEPS